LYGHVDNIELYVGLYAEDLRNSALPPLVGRLIGIDAFSQVLTNPLLGKCLQSRNFSPVGWEEIQNTKTLRSTASQYSKTGKKSILFYREEWQFDELTNLGTLRIINTPYLQTYWIETYTK